MGNNIRQLLEEDTNQKTTVDKSFNDFVEEASFKIIEICNSLIRKKLNERDLLNKIEEYIKNYNRIIYSTISNFIFSSDDNSLFNLQTNIEQFCNYVHSMNFKKEYKNVDEVEKIKVFVLKMYDHINLAVYQYHSFKDSDEEFKTKFAENIEPLRNGIDRQLKEVTSQQISMLAIFTAISFVVFGGISSASSIFSNASSLSLSELMILASIWALGICNLVYFLIYYMAKLGKISIKTNNRLGANVFRRHPYIVLMNFLLASILLLSLWGYVIESTVGINWLIDFINKNEDFLLICTILILILIIGLFIYIIYKINNKKDDYRY